jgi:pimeloyl-ACP methyl ester carboxylesterase
MTTLTQPLSKNLRVNGLAVHYLEWGEADAPAIVCVHGYTGSADAFNALARHLEDRFHIFAPDVRGHGESAWSPAAPTDTKTRRATWQYSPDSWGSKSSC